MNIAGSSYNQNSNLENTSNQQDDIDEITQILTGITYNSGTDTTTIDNNVNITGNLSIPDYANINDTLDDILESIVELFDKTTDISYDTNVTTIDGALYVNDGVVFDNGLELSMYGISDVGAMLNAQQTSIEYFDSQLWGFEYNDSTHMNTYTSNIELNTGYNLTIDGLNVKTSIDSINTTLTDVSYSSDTTTINNNVVISSGKTLTVDGTNIKSSINTINTTLTDISYSSDTTTINNNVVISSGKTLTVDNINISNSVVVYDTSGTYNITAPTNAKSAYIFVVAGGGGAGSSGYGSIGSGNANQGGGGGGSGGCGECYIAFDATRTFTIVVGGGGSALSDSNGGTGGNSSVTYKGITLCYATGGGGGTKGNNNGSSTSRKDGGSAGEGSLYDGIAGGDGGVHGNITGIQGGAHPYRGAGGGSGGCAVDRDIAGYHYGEGINGCEYAYNGCKSVTGYPSNPSATGATIMSPVSDDGTYIYFYGGTSGGAGCAGGNVKQVISGRSYAGAGGSAPGASLYTTPLSDTEMTDNSSGGCGIAYVKYYY